MLGYHAKTNNRDWFFLWVSVWKSLRIKGEKARLAHYLRFIYEKGGLIPGAERRSEIPDEIRAVPSELHGTGLERKRLNVDIKRNSWIIKP